MKLEGSVALVVGADSAVGAAIARGLLARDAAKVYAASIDPRSDPGAVPLVVDPARPAFADELARQLADVTLLVNCLVAVQHAASSMADAGIQLLGGPLPPAGCTRKLIDAFAPVLAANGGGAVANVLCVLYADQPLDATHPETPLRTMDRALGEGLRHRLAARRTQLLYFRAQLAVGHRDEVFGGRHALAGHVAMRVLEQLEAGGHDTAPPQR